MEKLKQKVINIFNKELDNIIEKQNKPRQRIKPRLNDNFFEELDSIQKRIEQTRNFIQSTKK